MRRKFLNKIFALSALTLTSAISLTVAVTAAAFLNVERHNQQVTINVDYSTYFGSNGNGKADGTINNPYVISTPDHLRNLSYLVNMGVFKETDCFELKSFTYSGASLTPIGNEQFPFKSQFYGVATGSNKETVPAITNLSVEGNNLSDVGLFGVVGPSAKVHDFILVTPTINVSGTAPYSADKIDQNPLRNITQTFNGSDVIFSKANVSSQINITNTKPVKLETTIVGMESFTLTKGTLPTQYPFTSSANLPLTYYCSSSNETLVSMTGDINTGNATFTVNKVNNPDNSANPKVGDYVIIEIGVKGIVATPNGNRYAQMTLERFKLYYDYKKKYVIADTLDGRMYKKIINPVIIKTKENDSNMLIEDDSKGIFVGAVIGMLYGDARRIGVNNATLNIKRPFISNSILVGRTLDDDENKNMTKESISTPQIIKDSDAKLTYQYTPKTLINYGNIPNSDLKMGNRIVKNIYGREGMSEQSMNTIRVYATRRPSNASKDENIVAQDEGVILTRNKVYTGVNTNGASDGAYMTEDNRKGLATDKYTTSILPAISFRSTMQEGLHDLVNNETSTVFYSKGYNNMEISNSIMLWVSGADGKAGISRWFANGIDFYLDIELDYAMYVDDYGALTNNNASNIEIGIEGTRKTIQPIDISAPWGKTVRMQFDQPKNSISRGNDSKGQKISHMDVVRANEEPKGNYEYIYGRYQNPIDETADARNLTRFTANEINGKVSTLNEENHISKIHTKRIKIKSENAGFLEGHNKSKNGLFPLFFIGPKHISEFTKAIDERIHQDPMPPAPKKEAFRLDIYGMRVIISDLKGNINSTIGQIDFVDSSTSLPINGNGWNGTNIKVGAKTIENSKVVANGSADTTKLMNVHSEANGITNYKITTSKSGNSVTITWNPIGATATQFSYIQPKSNIKYNNLTITKAK